MDDCVFKPINLSVLSQRLSAIVPKATPAEELDIDSFYSMSGRDNSRVRKLLEELQRSNREDLKTLLELHMDDGLQSFVQIAHRIKGAARIVGAS